MKIGDLVIRSRKHIEKTNIFYNSWILYGLVLEWYDRPKGLVSVAWFRKGDRVETNPSHISNLEVISENR